MRAGFPFLFGCNYPWTLLDGVGNYGRDVGATPEGLHTGLSTRRELVARVFVAMRSLGLRALRWFLFCDGRAGIRFDNRGIPTGFTEHVLADLDVAVELADRNGLLLIPVFFDYLWMFPRIEDRDERGVLVYSAPGHPEAMKSEVGRRALVDTIIRPVLDRYARSRSIFAWEFMNEPDWVVEGPDLDRKRISEPVAFENFCALVWETGEEVHARTQARYTLGTARARNVPRWGNAELGVDFLQVHAYEDFWRRGHDIPIGGRRVEDLGVSLPVVVGEYPINGGEAAGELRRGSAYGSVVPGFVDGLQEAGFAGALFWSFNNVDRCGLESLAMIDSALTTAAPRLRSSPPSLA